MTTKKNLNAIGTLGVVTWLLVIGPIQFLLILIAAMFELLHHCAYALSDKFNQHAPHLDEVDKIRSKPQRTDCWEWRVALPEVEQLSDDLEARTKTP